MLQDSLRAPHPREITGEAALFLAQLFMTKEVPFAGVRDQVDAVYFRCMGAALKTNFLFQVIRNRALFIIILDKINKRYELYCLGYLQTCALSQFGRKFYDFYGLSTRLRRQSENYDFRDLQTTIFF